MREPQSKQRGGAKTPLVAATVLGIVLVGSLALGGFLVTRSGNDPRTDEVGGHGSSNASPSTNAQRPPEITATIPVNAAGEIALDHDSAWVTDVTSGVSQIDGTTNELGMRVATGRVPSGISATDEAVWVANKGDDTVTRVDPDTGHVRATINVGNLPVDVSATQDAVWVTHGAQVQIAGEPPPPLGDQDLVLRIDARSNEIAGRVEVPHGVSGLSATSAAIWLTNATDGTLIKVDPVTTQIIDTIQLDVRPDGLAATDDAVWIMSTDAIIRVDASTDQVIETIQLGSSPLGIAATADGAWVIRNDGTLTQINPETNTPTDIIDSGNAPLSLAANEESVWVVDLDDGIVRIDPGAK